MESFKIIDISGNSSKKPKKKFSKKQIYKEILSSSDKVQEIISNRKKTKRFDYLNMIPKIKEQPPPQQDIPTQTISNESASIQNNLQSSKTINKQKNNTISQEHQKKKKPRVKRSREKSKSKLKDSKINEYFQPKQNTVENRIVEKAQQSVIDHLQTEARGSISPTSMSNLKTTATNFKPINPTESNRNIKPNRNQVSKEINENNNTSTYKRRLYNSQSNTLRRQPLRSQPKQFTTNQIKDILIILIKLNKHEQLVKFIKL